MFRFACALLLTVAAIGCHPNKSPELTMIGVHDNASQRVVVLQVSNPADRPMRLTHLAYTFAAGSETLAQGELELAREVPASSAVVVEVPFDTDAPEPTASVTLRGTLTAKLDEIVQKFNVSALVKPVAK